MFMCFAVVFLVRTIHYTSIFSYWANQELGFGDFALRHGLLESVAFHPWPMQAPSILLLSFAVIRKYATLFTTPMLLHTLMTIDFQLARHDAVPTCERLRFKTQVQEG